MRTRHQDDVREKIQATQLINRLTSCAMGEIELNPQQLKSIEILLKKSLPDLSSVEMSGPDGEAIPINVGIEFVSGKSEVPGQT